MIAMDAPETLTMTQGVTMAQSGWGRGAQVRLRKGGRRVVHVLLPDEGPSSMHVRRSPMQLPWVLQANLARNNQGVAVLQVSTWRGEIGVISIAAITDKNTGFTPIVVIIRMMRLSRLVCPT